MVQRVNSGSTPWRRSASWTGGRCTMSGVLPRGVRSSRVGDLDRQVHLGGNARARIREQGFRVGGARTSRWAGRRCAPSRNPPARPGIAARCWTSCGTQPMPVMRMLLRAHDELLLAAEHSFERAQAERQLFELAFAPARRQPHQVAGAVSHDGQQVVPERRADDFVQAVLAVARQRLPVVWDEFDARISMLKAVFAGRVGGRERDALRLAVVVDQAAAEHLLHQQPGVAAKDFRGGHHRRDLTAGAAFRAGNAPAFRVRSDRRTAAAGANLSSELAMCSTLVCVTALALMVMMPAVRDDLALGIRRDHDVARIVTAQYRGAHGARLDADRLDHAIDGRLLEHDGFERTQHASAARRWCRRSWRARTTSRSRW